MAYDTVLYDVADRICTIALNRPEKLNAWTRQMHIDRCMASSMALAIVTSASTAVERMITACCREVPVPTEVTGSAMALPALEFIMLVKPAPPSRWES